MNVPVFAVLLMLPAGLAAAGLDDVKQEKDLSKRSERSLAYAESAMKRAQGLVANMGSRAELEKELEEVAEACKLALDSLKETGKPPRKLGRQYKRGELKTREILRQLEDLALALGIGDRAPAEKARDAVTSIHDEFLLGVMGQSKK